MDNTFLSIPPDAWVASNDLAFAVRDINPVSPGHTLVIPRHHVPDWWSTSAEQRTAIWDLVDVVKADLDRDFTPDAYNVGFNAGQAAGQTIFHLHVHVVPRYSGDVADPAGSVRRIVSSDG